MELEWIRLLAFKQFLAFTLRHNLSVTGDCLLSYNIRQKRDIFFDTLLIKDMKGYTRVKKAGFIILIEAVA